MIEPVRSFVGIGLSHTLYIPGFSLETVKVYCNNAVSTSDSSVGVTQVKICLKKLPPHSVYFKTNLLKYINLRKIKYYKLMTG